MGGHTLTLGNDWDLHVGEDGNLQKSYESYAIAQNVANAFRLFTNDAYYNPTKGIPHFAIELKKAPALSILQARLKKTALQNPNVKTCDVQLAMIKDRELTGFADMTLNNGDHINVKI